MEISYGIIAVNIKVGEKNEKKKNYIYINKYNNDNSNTL